ncbi:MAG: IPT/TIG domain-containing protein [Nitrospirae bacterium]|nr:IPT/TIG domain-containing protein [Nitrospirota bacterium]
MLLCSAARVIAFIGVIGMVGQSVLLAEDGKFEEGTGFSMFGTQSIKGVDGTKVEKDPVCDRSRRPKITKVQPDEVKPGDKVVIKGENFGTKECLHSVSFNAAPNVSTNYKFVDESTIEATVPEAKGGMTFITVVTGSGNAQSRAVLIKK